MNILEAIVWCFGILVTGVTICSVAGSFSRAKITIKNAQEEVKKNDHEDNSPQC